jgi:hypothetical protein
MQRAYVRTGAQGCRNQSQPQNGVMVRLPPVLQASGGAGWLHVRTAQRSSSSKSKWRALLAQATATTAELLGQRWRRRRAPRSSGRPKELSL